MAKIEQVLESIGAMRQGRTGRFSRGVRRGLYGIFDLTAMTAVLALVVLIYIRFYGEWVIDHRADALQAASSAVIEDRTGTAVWRASLPEGGYREVASAAEIPLLVKQAFIGTEDRRYALHEGIDYTGIVRAAAVNVRSGGTAEGGSSITQQLARNVYLTLDQTWMRKLNEASIALALERHYVKDEILTMYLNEIYMGRGQYGIKAASRRYFGTAELNRLELWQIAILAGIPKAPSAYNPVDDPERAAGRAKVVLGLMAEQGVITAAEADAAAVRAAAYEAPQQSVVDAAGTAAYAAAALREAARKTGLPEEQLRGGGYRIETGLDAAAQAALTGVFAEDAYFPPDMGGQQTEAAMVVVDHRDGEVRALAGGRNGDGAGLNRAVDMKRQPGSAFKPIIAYGPALESGRFSPDSVLPDVLQTYGGYSPRNVGGVYRGSLTMTEALTRSINSPAVWLLNQTGISQAIEFAARLGIELGSEDEHLAIALGGLHEGVSPLQLAQAYSVIANGGTFRSAHFVRSVTDAQGQEIYRFDPEAESRPAMSAWTSAALAFMLRNAVAEGTGQAARIPNRIVGGKTGTVALAMKEVSQAANRDVWFAGFTPEWTAAVWMGFDRTDSGHYLTVPGSAAAGLFSAAMGKMLAGR
ncbi:transglycosylase domain-containing protein [Saccharibacillus endophyticus]|uniref:Penicillin-binding protein 1F n=1 Tax=Saccharibacillus endophyticus TaxID=2060666 RepID=A0ABQ1ZTS3_9BACL|nr:PBP1A family penicillin-binding protein [Saccharibacillus endophyticus]GGH79095.1 penicillin-binding protein 1F [Saccharibacillus endophyticus]